MIENSSIPEQDKSITNLDNLMSVQFDKQIKKNLNMNISALVIEHWKYFCEYLIKDDKNTFIKMVNDCYNGYHNSINSRIIEKSDSCLTRTTFLFMTLFLYQQKQINYLNQNNIFSINCVLNS
jgi:hypothetical protein